MMIQSVRIRARRVAKLRGNKAKGIPGQIAGLERLSFRVTRMQCSGGWHSQNVVVSNTFLAKPLNDILPDSAHAWRYGVLWELKKPNGRQLLKNRRSFNSNMLFSVNALVSARLHLRTSSGDENPEPDWVSLIAVPNCFEGSSFQQYRREQEQLHLAELNRVKQAEIELEDAQRKLQEMLYSPTSTEEDGRFAKRLLGLEGM